MTLGRKDVAATGLTVLVVLVFLAASQGWGVPLVGDSNRWAAGAIALLGLATCALGSPVKGRTTALLSALGFAALVLTVIALWTGSLTALALLTADVVLLWAASTLRHALHAPGRTIAA
jgi:hypothetical protein